MTRANKAGTERHRDEARRGGGPRMHGKPWHEHAQPHDLDRVRNRAPEPFEAAEEIQGMGKHIGRKEKGTTRVTSPSPRGKGKPGIKKNR